MNTDKNICRLCGSKFTVTPEMITETREECPPEYGPMTDAEVINIIECCPACAGWEPRRVSAA